jgi:glycosyltransferase involved in cell wall biosynthesis
LFYHQRGDFDPERLKFRSLKKRLYLSLLERPLLQHATTLIALTSAEAHSYRLLGIDRPCEVVPNGVWVSEGSANRALLGNWNIRDEHKVILFLGRVHPLKGADTLLSAFASVAARIRDAVLVLAGPDEFGLEQSYRAEARRLGLEHRVIFTGMVEGEAKDALLARANLFCLPSVGEGFSMAVLEALATGVPVLLTPGCHFDEVEQAGAGRVVQKTPAAIAAAAVELLSDPSQLAAMASAGRELVRIRYGWDRVVDRVVDVYEQGLARHPRQSND